MLLAKSTRFPGANVRPGHGRLGSKKSSSGCATCKVRKVKCDEARPACRRCESTGRRCDGYKSVKPNMIRSSSSITQVPSMPFACRTVCGLDGRDELISFEFFVHSLAPNLTGVVDGSFWRQLIPQLSQFDTIIWHAVVALSCLVRHPQYSNELELGTQQKSPVSDRNHRRALGWYTKSISGLREHLSSYSSNSVIALVSCVLYICIECLQDNIAEAEALFRKGFEVLDLVAARDTNPKHQYIEGTIRSLFRHMATSHGMPVQRMIAQSDLARPFRSLAGAREELYVLLGQAHAFIVDVNELKANQEKTCIIPSELALVQQQLQIQFYRWSNAFENMKDRTEYHRTSDEIELRSTLHVAFNHYYIWLMWCTSNFETGFDQYLGRFQIMVAHAQRAVEITRPDFVFETRFIPSMFFVATKCRDPITRRQAITILRKGPKMENVWKAEPMAIVAERVIGIEESGNESGAFRGCPERIDVPPETSRLYRQTVVEVNTTAGKSEQFLSFGMWHQDGDSSWSRMDCMVKL